MDSLRGCENSPFFLFLFSVARLVQQRVGDVQRLVGAALEVGTHIRKDNARERIAAARHEPVDVVLNELILHIVDALFKILGLLEPLERFGFEDIHGDVETLQHADRHLAQLVEPGFRDADLRGFLLTKAVRIDTFIFRESIEF